MASMEQEKKEKVYVIVRVRPLSRQEATSRSPWKLSSKCIASNKTCRPTMPNHSYTFDRIYGTKTSTLDIYNAHVKDIIMTTMSGINGTVIAYGQARSGKTFTLRGSSEEVGILMLAVKDIFQIVQEATGREFLIRMSYLEVANNELNDLLASKTHKLDIREDPELGVVIAGSREEIVNKSEQVISLLDFAEARRAVESTNSNNRGVSHTVFRLVIESTSLDKKNDPFDTHETDGYQFSVLNLVEVATAKACVGKSDNSPQEGMQPDKCLIALESVISKLNEGTANEGDYVPYSESRLTHILQPSLGGSARTCFICNISPAMVHMEATIAALEFAARITKVMNCFKVNEVCMHKALLKRQKREIVELRNKLKELRSPDLEEEILNRRNALLMIELEREQMSLELFERTPSSSQGENKEQDQEQRTENITFEGESGLDKCFDMPLGDFGDPLQKRNFTDYLGFFNPAQGLQELDLDLQMNCSGLCFGPSAGTKRKRRSNPTAVADKLEQVDLLFQSKVAREVSWMKSESIAERQKLLELQAFIAQENNEQQELLTQGDENCKNLQRKIAELEAEKALLEKKLNEQEVSHSKAMEALKCELALEKSRNNTAEVPLKGVVEAGKSPGANGCEVQRGNSRERLPDLDENAVKQNAETQSCTSQEIEDQQRISKDKEGQTTPTKKKPSKANKVFQKFQSFQGRSELSSVRKELAVAKETITALEDERNSLWKDLNQMKTKCKEIVSKLEVNKIEEGVAEIKVLNGATGDISDSLEYAKMQLTALRHGKLTSDKELFSMKSELAKLECVVERQSGVLKVLSDNDNLLNELASVRAAMKEAAGASELQMSSIQQEYDGKLKELESDYKHWRQEYLHLEEEQTKLQDKLSTAEAEVMRLTQALDEKSKQDKRPAKNIKARLAEAEAELERLNDQLKEKIQVQEQLADSKVEMEKLKDEVEEKTRLENEHNQVLNKLAKSEAVIVSLTAACEENKALDLEQKNLQLKLESEIATLTKLLDEKSGVEEEQKKIQTDLATLQEKIDNLTQEVEQKDVLEKKHCDLLVRLDTSEKEVTRLTELLDTSKEQSDMYVGEMLERFRISEAEVVTLNESLQREIEERQRLEEEHIKDLNNIEQLEAKARRLAESLKKVQKEREGLDEEHMKVVDVIASMKAEIEVLTCSLTSVTEMKEVVEKEKQHALDALVTTEAELKRLADSLHQDLELREKLEKELRDSHDHTVSLEADMKKVTETLERVLEEKDKLEKDHRKDLEVIAVSEMKIKGMTESLQQGLEEKILLEKEVRKGLDEVASSEAKIRKLNQRLERKKEETKILAEELKKGHDDHANSESRVTRLAKHVDEELEEKKKLETRLEEISVKLAHAEGEVANMAQSLAKVSQEKGLLEKEHSEILETCTRLKLETARFSKSMTRETESREMFEREISVGFEECARLTPSKVRKAKERRCSNVDHETAVVRAASLQNEVVKLRENLAGELEDRKKLEMDHAEVLDQLVMSRAEAASLSESLTKGAEMSKSLMTDHSHTLSRLATSNSEIASLSDMLDDKPRLEEELQNYQLILAGSEAEIVRLNEELIDKGRLEDEQRRTQRQLAEADEELRKLRDENLRLEKEAREVLARSTTPDSEGLRLSDVTRLTEELQVVRSELAETKAELAIVRTALSKKLGLEEIQIKTQMELVDKQGECEKLSKELRINRKMVKEQKKLLRKLTSTQSEVSKLRTAIVGKSEEESIKTHGGERTDAAVTGPVGIPNVEQELDSELSRMRENLAKTEIEVRRLTSALEGKEKLEGDYAKVQLELARAETEILRLASTLDETSKVNEGDFAKVQLELARAETEIQRLAASLEETSRLNEFWKVFQLKLSDSAFSASRQEKDGLHLGLEEFLRELLEREKKLQEQETDLQGKVAAFEETKVKLLDNSRNPGKDYKCAECDVLQGRMEQIRKERDAFRASCIIAETKVMTLELDLDNQKKELEVLERNWKSKAQKSEKDLAELRVKVAKMEEGAGWIVREKKLLEERLTTSETQIATLREAARATNKDMEMTHHKLHLLTTQHQSDVAAFCNELSMKSARIIELEKEIQSLRSHPPPPTPVMTQNDFSSYLNSTFRPQQWPYPPLQPPQQQSPHWGNGSTPQR